MRLIGTGWCKVYTCNATFYVGERSGMPHLIVHYGEGYSGPDDLPTVDGCREFASGLPGPDWTVDAVENMIISAPGCLWKSAKPQ